MLAAFQVVSQNHFANRLDTLLFKEHMLCAAESDAFSPEITGYGGVMWGVGISSYLQASKLIGPAHEGTKFTSQLWRDGCNFTDKDLAGRTVEGNDIAFFKDFFTDLEAVGLVIYNNCGTTGNAAFAHAAGNDRRMRSHTSA